MPAALPPAAYMLLLRGLHYLAFSDHRPDPTRRCAGICELSRDPATGKFTRIRLKLSTPLLQYRPRSDTINTLLHEAIHAYFFITTSWRHSRGDDGTGHGEGFQLLADAINSHGSYEVTIFHSFHDEVVSTSRHVHPCMYLQHVYGVSPIRIASGRTSGNAMDPVRIGHPILVS